MSSFVDFTDFEEINDDYNGLSKVKNTHDDYDDYDDNTTQFYKLLRQKKIDVISCILANFLLDLQPFLVISLGLNTELHGFSHTLIFAVTAGTLFFGLYGIIVRKMFKSQQPLSSFIAGGVLGGVLHVIVDSFYHRDVKPFFPFSNLNFAYLNLSDKVITVCLVGYFIFFVIVLIKSIKLRRFP